MKVDGAAAEEPDPRLGRKRVEDDERIHPAAMGRPDEEVAAGRQVLPAGRLDPEPEQAEHDRPGEQAERAGR